MPLLLFFLIFLGQQIWRRGVMSLSFWEAFGGVKVNIIFHFFLYLGGPFHEVIIDGKIFNVDFDGMDRPVSIGGKTHQLRLEAPVPEVKILGPTDPETGLPIQIHHGPKMYSTSQVKKDEPVVSAPALAAPAAPAVSATPIPPPPPPSTLLPPAPAAPSVVPELAPPPFMSQSLPTPAAPATGTTTTTVPAPLPEIPPAPYVPPGVVTPAPTQTLAPKPLDPLGSLLPGLPSAGKRFCGRG